MSDPIVTIDGFSYAYPGSTKAILQDVSLTLGAGTTHLLTGPTGSGKSTLLMAIRGLLPKGKSNGHIHIGNHQTGNGHTIGLVMQNPETQLFRTSIGAEVAFGLENNCMAAEKMHGTTMRALAAVGLDKALDTPTSSLSMGQRYRLILAAMLAMDHRILLLDEPGAQLDPAGIESLKKWLLRLKSHGITVLISEHHPAFFSDLIDTHWHLDAFGKLHQTGNTEKASPAGARIPAPHILPASAPEIVRLDNLSAAPDGGEPVWTSASFSVRKGERIGVHGANGSGKTTLLQCLAGFLKPLKGRVRVLGQYPSPKKLRGHISYLSQSPPKLLFGNTVRL